MTTFVKPRLPGKKVEDTLKDSLEPFILPSRGKTEEVFCYVTGIKFESPFDYAYFDGVDFAKRVKSPEASLVSNDGKHYDFKMPTKLLTENQVKAIMERARRRYKVITGRPNLDYDHTKKDEREFLPALKVRVADFLILCKQADYKPYEAEKAFLEQQVEEANKEIDVAQELSEKIYDAQHPKKTGKKGK